MDIKKIKYKWFVNGTYSGKGFGWSKTPEAAKKSAIARLEKLKRQNPNNGTSYSIMIHKEVQTITYKTQFYRID
jgi:hypothetical protein